MNQISSLLPVDGAAKPIANGNLIGPILAKTYNASISSAVDITLNVATTSIEILAITSPVIVRFAATASTTNFDAVVAANATKVFARDPAVTVISVIQAAASGAVAVIEK